MKSLSVQQMESTNGALSAKAGCIASLIGYVGSIATLCIATGGTAALIAAAAGHVLDDIALGFTCAMWLSQSSE